MKDSGKMTQITATRSCSEILADFASGLTFEDIPSHVVANVKDHILDTVGCLLAGSTTDWIRRTNGVAKRMGGAPEATIIGDGARVGVASAVLANGAMGRALDLDDTHFRPWEHVSAYIVPTAFTAGEWLGRSDKDVITAAIAGYEIACRVGLVRFRDKKFMHDTSLGSIDIGAASVTGSVFASAVVVGKLMGLDASRLTSAMGFAGSLGLFLFQTHTEKAEAMPFNTGWACHGGIIAAMMADSGLRGPRQVFEGDRGFFQALIAAEPHDVSRLVQDLGSTWECAQGTIKMYPAGHGTHYFLNSIKTLMRERGLRAEDVMEITCLIPRLRAEFHFSPPEKVYKPGPYDARFSLPYLLAALLVDGQLGVRSFTEKKVKDQRILSVARRVSYTLSEEAWSPPNRGHLIVKTRDGKVLEEKTPHNKLPGTSENPLPREEIFNKFRDNSSLVLSSEKTEKLLDTLTSLEKVQNVADVMRMAAP